jgi:hypothetical protein
MWGTSLREDKLAGDLGNVECYNGDPAHSIDCHDYPLQCAAEPSNIINSTSPQHGMTMSALLPPLLGVKSSSPLPAKSLSAGSAAPQ